MLPTTLLPHGSAPPFGPLPHSRVGLPRSLRQLQDDPWVKRVEHLKEGLLVEGTITHLTKFGAFARLDEDLEGLIHVSEMSDQRIAHPKEVVHEGDVVTLRVIKIDSERHRIGLSLSKVDSPAYADLDWKMALADEVGKVHDDKQDEDSRSIVFGSDKNIEQESLIFDEVLEDLQKQIVEGPLDEEDEASDEKESESEDLSVEIDDAEVGNDIVIEAVDIAIENVESQEEEISEKEPVLENEESES